MTDGIVSFAIIQTNLTNKSKKAPLGSGRRIFVLVMVQLR